MAEVSIIKATYSIPGIDKLLEPLGGMARYINKGDRVLLKVNLVAARKPERAVTTHPEFVRAVARAVKNAGGIPFIGDSPGGVFSFKNLKKAYKLSGLVDLAKEENIPLNYDTSVKKLDLPKHMRQKRLPVCKYVLDADKIIALPKLKTHSSQYMTLACKIMYGAVPGLTKAMYHAQFPTKVAFADMLIDVLCMVQPQLFIMDGILGMQGQGPSSGDPINLGFALASADPVAMDIAICKMIGIEPVGIPVLKRAKVRGLWPKEIIYPILKPECNLIEGFVLPNTAAHLRTGERASKKRPLITENCIGCGECERICPRGAVKVCNGIATVDYSKCIQCFCCHEICPEEAIRLGK